AAEGAPEEDAVLSFGRELSSAAEEPPWASLARAALENMGYRVADFDGLRSHVSFAGAGDPTMAFAARFAQDSYGILWLGPRLRARLTEIESRERASRAFAEARHLPSIDVSDGARQAAARKVDG